MVPENQAKISVFDVGRLYGATFYESIRTFRHKFFKLEQHLTRLEASLRYAGLPDLVDRQQILDAIRDVYDANIHLTDDEDDLWVCVEVSPGNAFPMPLKSRASQPPTVVAYSSELPYHTYVRNYTEGKHVVTSHFRNIPPQCFEQRCKNRSRLPHFMSKLYAGQVDPDAFALLLDTDGFLTEGSGANIFFVLDNVLYTPTTRNILNGISRQTVIELAGDLGVGVVEKDLTLYEAYNAEEAFWTTTSYCILPISAIDGRKIGTRYPGPCAQQLLDAWSNIVGMDIVGQAQKCAREDGSNDLSDR
jgi:branched-chain amino acid aminotransferase